MIDSNIPARITVREQINGYQGELITDRTGRTTHPLGTHDHRSEVLDAAEVALHQLGFKIAEGARATLNGWTITITRSPER